MSLDEVLSDITPTNKSLKDKMRFTKKYKCLKCGYIFSKVSLVKFIKTIMPKCPTCGSEDIQNIDYIEKKKEK